ncbi:MAG: hypothetical protein JXB13_17965 [Phycisphaerae bacterium]|nr:hypothetical protein [Phycisphaerae bacterium]
MSLLPHLSMLDAGVVLLYLVGMVVVGLLFRHQRSSEDFLLAGRGMGWLPVGLSVMASLFSANSLVFYPGEAFRYGLLIAVGLLAVYATAPIVMRWIIPFYVRSNCVTAYEMLERRFDVRLRVLAAILFIVLRLGWMAATTYACALAISVITGANLYLTIVVLGAVATLYTTTGGLKAVMWTDVAQFVVFAVAIVIVILVAARDVPGGLPAAWTGFVEAGQARCIDLRLSWTLRMGTWAVLLGTFVETLSGYTADQVTVQRFLASRSVRHCRMGFVTNLAGVGVVVPGLLLCGIALHGYYRANSHRMVDAAVAYFDRCPADLARVAELPDRLAPAAVGTDVPNRQARLRAHYAEHPDRAVSDLFAVDRQDEVFPYFVRTELPRGLIGLVLAALFAATMSSIDSGIHSTATVLITDIRKRLWPRKSEPDGGDGVRRIRMLTLLLGAVGTGLACGVQSLGTVFEITKKVIGAPAGPLLAVFLLAIFSRRARGGPVFAGALAGTVVAFGLTYASSIFPLWFCVIGFAVTWTIGFGGSRLLGPARPPAA